MTSYLVTTALIITPFIYACSGALSGTLRPPRGIAIMLVTVVAWLPLAMSGFRPAAVAGAAGATVAAAVVDVALARSSGKMTGRRLPAASAGLAALIWTGQLVGIASVSGIAWPVSMWLGAVMLSSGVAAGLAYIAEPEESLREKRRAATGAGVCALAAAQEAFESTSHSTAESKPSRI